MGLRLRGRLPHAPGLTTNPAIFTHQALALGVVYRDYTAARTPLPLSARLLPAALGALVILLSCVTTAGTKDVGVVTTFGRHRPRLEVRAGKASDNSAQFVGHRGQGEHGAAGHELSEVDVRVRRS